MLHLFFCIRLMSINITFCIFEGAPRSSPFMPPVPKVWTKTNSSVVLTYTIVAHPPPSTSSAFVWRKKVNDHWVIINDTRRLQILISQDRLQTNLSILQVQDDDFANYRVKVDNDIGSTEQTFVIQANGNNMMSFTKHFF